MTDLKEVMPFSRAVVASMVLEISRMFKESSLFFRLFLVLVFSDIVWIMLLCLSPAAFFPRELSKNENFLKMGW